MCTNEFSIGRLRGIHVSSNVSEAIRRILNLFIFFSKKISQILKGQNAYKLTKTKKTAFYVHKKHIRRRKSLAWHFVLFVFFMLFMLFMCIKNI